MLNLVSVLELSLLNVLLRVLKLQESYVQEIHGRYDKQFNSDVTDRHGNKLKRSRRHILEFMTNPKTTCVID